MLQVQVSKKNVKDYNNFVRPEDEIWVKKINGKLAKSGYSSSQQFMADVHQLLMNAEAYNLGGGLCAFPGIANLPLFVVWTNTGFTHVCCLRVATCFQACVFSHVKLQCFV